MESLSCDGEVAEESEIHSTKRPTALSRKRKREAQEDKLLEKAVSLMVSGPSTSMAIAKEDDEDIFGRFIASELRAIADPQIKRLVKWNIQSAIFNVSMPSVQQPYPFTGASSPWCEEEHHSFYSDSRTVSPTTPTNQSPNNGYN